MPDRDGTGPRNIGRNKTGNGIGIGGECVCLNCGERIPHQQGIPCNTVNCPKCGNKMTRA